MFDWVGNFHCFFVGVYNEDQFDSWKKDTKIPEEGQVVLIPEEELEHEEEPEEELEHEVVFHHHAETQK